MRSNAGPWLRIRGRFRSEKLRISLLGNKLESRVVISANKMCWPGKGRRKQVGQKEGLRKPAEGAEE